VVEQEFSYYPDRGSGARIYLSGALNPSLTDRRLECTIESMKMFLQRTIMARLLNAPREIRFHINLVSPIFASV
jgi:hypothetical protein